jgi:hypothetical protein
VEGSEGVEEGVEEGGEDGTAHVDEFEHGAVGDIGGDVGGDQTRRGEPCEQGEEEKPAPQLAPNRPNLFGAFAFAGGATSSSTLARRRGV